MSKLRVLDLFSGIGGFSLGLERTGGFETVAFCEIDPFCRRVLRKHWPDVPIYDDVRELTAERLRADGIVADVICGGFPCQDISNAGKGEGITGARSGLWSEYARLASELRPSFILVENVAALLGRGLDRVLGDLAAIRFDAEWYCIPASAIGAPHRRDRLWLVGYPARLHGDGRDFHGGSYQQSGGAGEAVPELGNMRPVMAHANSTRFPLAWPEPQGADGRDTGRTASASSWWSVEPDVGRVAHGVPSRVDRLRGLGNAVVPQIPELIGRAILQSEAA